MHCHVFEMPDTFDDRTVQFVLAKTGLWSTGEIFYKNGTEGILRIREHIRTNDFVGLK